MQIFSTKNGQMRPWRATKVHVLITNGVQMPSASMRLVYMIGPYLEVCQRLWGYTNKGTGPFFMIVSFWKLVPEPHGGEGRKHVFIFGRSRIQISARRPAILTEAFMAFLNPSKQMPEECLKLGHGPFLPHNFQSMFHQPSCHSTLYSVSY
jgi:hypothetical protein